MIHVVFICSQLFVVSMGMVSSKTVKYQQGWKGIKEIKKMDLQSSAWQSEKQSQIIVYRVIVATLQLSRRPESLRPIHIMFISAL